MTGSVDFAQTCIEVVISLKTNYCRIPFASSAEPIPTLSERNDLWFPKITALFPQKGVHLVTAGESHWLHEAMGLLGRFREEGYRVELAQVDPRTSTIEWIPFDLRSLF